MRIGAHVSTAGGVDKAIDRAQSIGAECIQIFGSQPQTWRRRLYDDTQAQTFQVKSLEMDVAPTFLHGIYLINLATSNPDNLERSQEALVHDMHIAAQLGAAGVIFHTGSHKGAGYDQVFPQIVEAVRKVLDLSPPNVWLLLENSAGMGDGIGSKFSELGRIIHEVGDDRLRVCLDTQHTFAAGYNIASADGLAETLEEFDRDIGLARLAAVHANDSKVPLGDGVDRHENIGEGFIGKEGFEIIVQHDAFAYVPFLLEVPGFEKKGPDKENINILRELAGFDPIPYPVEQSL